MFKFSSIEQLGGWQGVMGLQFENAVGIKHGKKIGCDIIDEVRAKVENLEVAKGLSVRTALVYDGALAPSVEADRYFDFLLPLEKLLRARSL